MHCIVHRVTKSQTRWSNFHFTLEGVAGREGVDHSRGWRLFAKNTLPKVTELVGVKS